MTLGMKTCSRLEERASIAHMFDGTSNVNADPREDVVASFHVCGNFILLLD